MRTEKPIVLNTSKEAATFQTGISGWVSRTGRFWGDDERMARWDGCTHVVCSCGKSVEKMYVKCDECRDKDDAERFAKMEPMAWDGKTPLCDYNTDKFFWSCEDLDDYCRDENLTVKQMRLVICEPVYATEIDPSAHYCDDLPEGEDVPDVLLEAFDALNKVIRERRIVLSWQLGKRRAVIQETP